MAVPRTVVTEDQRLEKVRESSAEDLMRHRWHWTVNEDNAEKVAIRAYARAVSRNERGIRMDANGYALMQQSAEGTLRSSKPGDPPLTATEARELAGMSEDTAAAAQAVAKARGIQVGTVRKSRSDEVKQVRDMARDLAEKNGTSVDEEALAIAERKVKHEHTRQRHRDERNKAHSLRYVEASKDLTYVRGRLLKTVKLFGDVEFDEEETQLLKDDLDKAKQLLSLLELGLAGSEIDWDAEVRAVFDESDAADADDEDDEEEEAA